MFRVFDIFNEEQRKKILQYKSFDQGDFLVVRIKKFYEKTKILLSGEIDNIKPRPIIVLTKENNSVIIVATSTFKFFKYRRPKIDLSPCYFTKKTNKECLDLKIENKAFLFTKDGKRFKFYVKPEALLELYEERSLVECGNCSMLVPLIEKLLSEGR